MKIWFILFLEGLKLTLKWCRSKSFSAAPPATMNLAFPWISITGKEMLTVKSLSLTFLS